MNSSKLMVSLNSKALAQISLKCYSEMKLPMRSNRAFRLLRSTLLSTAWSWKTYIKACRWLVFIVYLWLPVPLSFSI